MFRKENTFIRHFNGADIYSGNTDKINEDNYDATLPFSLDTLRLSRMDEDLFYIKNNKQYTDIIIQVDLNKDYKDYVGEYSPTRKKKILTNKKKIRKELYLNGFDFKNNHYVFYKRSAGKAKNGYALFINEQLKEDMIDRSRLNLNYAEDTLMDITSLYAYETLIQSGLCDIIKIEPKEILLIDDIYGDNFIKLSSVTRSVNKEGKVNLITQDEELEIQNCLTDGQSLADEELFKRVKHIDKGFMLLRNDYMKTCGLKTKLQRYFESNNIDEVFDMFGNKHKAKDIKLVITPNSVKIWKIFGSSTQLKDKSKSEMWNYYINNIDSEFGIVKYDKEGNYGNYNRCTYQMLNATNLNYESIKNIASKELEYVKLLKNDLDVFKQFIGNSLHKKKEMALILRNNKNEAEYMEVMSTLLLANEQFAYTDKFKTFRRKMIENYINNLKRAKIRMEDTKYVTVFANPYEMLKATIGKYNGTSNMNDTDEYREIYCPYYSNNELLATSRNPHLNHGCLGLSKNIEREEYKWFGITNNICFINLMNNDTMDRYGGLDMDSDTILLTPQMDLVREAAQNEKLYPTPINKVEGSKVGQLNNMESLAKLDCLLCGNYIGKICNKAQIINSYMNHAIANNESEEKIKALYNLSSKLSSLSQIEIDRSKKVFEGLSMSKELKKINNTMFDGKTLLKFDNDSNSIILPTFFKQISKGNGTKVFEEFNTPMDTLQKVINKEIKRANITKKIDMCDLLVRKKDMQGHNPTLYQIKNIESLINKCAKKVTALNIKSRNESDKTLQKTMSLIAETKINTVENLKRIKMTDKLCLLILRAAYGVTNPESYNFSDNCNLLLTLLFKSHQSNFLRCFIELEEDVTYLQEATNGEINIFGNSYTRSVK